MLKKVIAGWSIAPGAPPNWDPNRDGACIALPVRVWPPDAIKNYERIKPIKWCESAWEPTDPPRCRVNEAIVKYVIFASYGNDSVALIQWAHETGLIDVVVLYSDTGWASDDWDARVSGAENWVRSLGYTPTRTASMGMEALVRSRSGWPRQGLQFCTWELKILPAKQRLDEIDPDKEATCLVGVRRAESANRRSFPEHTPHSPNHGERPLWAPLVDHTDEMRNALVHRAGFVPLPHRSMECFPCINSNRGDLRALVSDEARIAHIERIEKDLGYTSKGKPRTMFRPYRHMGATGIREIIRWAAAERGQFDPDDGTGGGNCDSGFCGS